MVNRILASFFRSSTDVEDRVNVTPKHTFYLKNVDNLMTINSLWVSRTGSMYYTASFESPAGFALTHSRTATAR